MFYVSVGRGHRQEVLSSFYDAETGIGAAVAGISTKTILHFIAVIAAASAASAAFGIIL